MAIDQHDLTVDFGYVIHGTLLERGCCNENTFSCPLPLESAGKFLDLGPADRVFPLLGLNVDIVQAEFVFLDNAVNSFVTGSADCLAGILPGASIAHLH